MTKQEILNTAIMIEEDLRARRETATPAELEVINAAVQECNVLIKAIYVHCINKFCKTGE